MSKNEHWPFIISNPHCGSVTPDMLRENVLLTSQQIIKDGDEQALEIYSPLKSLSQCYIEAIAARAFVDLNRRNDDYSKDGVVKTHTCWDEPIYRKQLTEVQVRYLLNEYYDSYHSRLLEAATAKSFSWLLDCHTMAEYPPPVAPDSNEKRPLVCLGNGNGQSCPPALFDKVVTIFNDVFDGQVSRNKPFAGGYICRNYGQYLPTIQVELSRTLDMSIVDKASRIQLAFERIANL